MKGRGHLGGIKRSQTVRSEKSSRTRAVGAPISQERKNRSEKRRGFEKNVGRIVKKKTRGKKKEKSCATLCKKGDYHSRGARDSVKTPRKRGCAEMRPKKKGNGPAPSCEKRVRFRKKGENSL